MKNIITTGSPNWQDRTKVKDVLFELKNRFGIDIRVITLGSKLGADLYIKNYSMDLGIKYAEYPTFNQPWTADCVEEEFMYGKPFDKRHLFMRNARLVKLAELAVVFYIPTDEFNRPINDLITQLEKKNKKVMIIQ